MRTNGKKTDRQERIVAELRARPVLRVSELADMFGVTTETIRRDLDELTELGRIARTHGGAAPRIAAEPAMNERELLYVDERERIARAAAAMIEPGSAVMIDSGATTAHFARRLSADGRNLTVITNSFAVAVACARNESIRVVMCPGDYNPAEGGVYGSVTAEFLKRFNVDTAVIGAGGIAERGVSDADPAAVWVKRAMMERAGRSILLADSGKFGRGQLEIVCPLSRISDIVTDAAPDKSLKKVLSSAGVKLHIAK